MMKPEASVAFMEYKQQYETETAATTGDYVLVVRIGGDPITNLGTYQYTVSGVNVISDNAVCLELYGASERYYAVLEGSPSLDFFIRVSIKESMNIHSYYQQQQNSLPNSPLRSNLATDDNPTTTTHTTTTGHVLMDLSAMMDGAHSMRDELLEPRRITFHFILTQKWQKTVEETAKDEQYESADYYNPKHWGENDVGHTETNGEADLVIRVAKQLASDVSTWISSKVVPKAFDDDSIPIPAVAPQPRKPEKTPPNSEHPIQPFITMLTHGKWFFMTHHEFQCGECETQNPLHAMLNIELMQHVETSGKPVTAWDQRRGVEQGIVTTDIAHRLIVALQRTTPAVQLLADSYDHLIQNIDVLLNQTKDNKNKLPQDIIKTLHILRRNRSGLEQHRACFFKRRNLGTPPSDD